MAENVMKGISEEELYNLPTAEYVYRRGGFIARQFTVYHVAFFACADLRDVQVISEWLSLTFYSRDSLLPHLINFIFHSLLSWPKNAREYPNYDVFVQYE